MYLKYGQELLDEDWAQNTFKDEQVIEGSDKFLTNKVQRLQQIGKQRKFKNVMADPLGIRFNKSE